MLTHISKTYIQKTLASVFGTGKNQRLFTLHVKYTMCASDFNQIWIFLTDIHKKSPMSNLT